MTATLKKIEDAGQAFSYYSERDDYYLSDKSAAEWHGKGAAILGLRGDIRPTDFKDALLGRVRGVRVGKEGFRTDPRTGNKVPKHTPGWDMTFSAPKSISIAALVYKDERLTTAHDMAVRVALDHLEQHTIITRQRKSDGAYDWRNTGTMAAGVVRHSTSRNQDPQLHSHAVVANMTLDPTTGKWVSVDSRAGLYKAQIEAGNVYMNALAKAAREAGYHVDWRVNKQGAATFDLREISNEEREVFSSRRSEVDAELAARNLTRETATAKERERATLDTRRAKDHLPAAVLHQRWNQQIEAVRSEPTHRPETVGEDAAHSQREAAHQAMKSSIEAITERDTRFTEREAIAMATTFTRGLTNQQQLANALREMRESGEVVHRETMRRAPSGELDLSAGLTTRKAINTERDLLHHAESLITADSEKRTTYGEVNQFCDEQEKTTGFEVTTEQREAARRILCGAGNLHILQGYAGTSKTNSVLSVVAKAAEAQGTRVRSMASTHSAAGTLGKALGTEGQTAASLLAKGVDSDGRKEVWIVDEATMLNAADVEQLESMSVRAGAHLVLVGDEKQIGSVGAGNAFAQLKAAHPNIVVELKDIHRQQVQELREAVYDSINGKYNAAMDKIQVTEAGDRMSAVELVADQRMQLVKQRSEYAGRDGKQHVKEGHSTLVVVLSKDDRSDVNEAIQLRRTTLGEVSNIREVATLERVEWSDAEREDAARWKEGDVIESSKSHRGKGPKKGELGYVVAIEQGRIHVEMGDGRQWSFNPRKDSSISAYEARTLRIGDGDQIVTKSNITAANDEGKPMKLANGTSMRVESIGNGMIHARTEHGEQVSIDTRHGAKVDLGYAETANQAQGRSVDAVIGMMRSNQTKLADASRFYVILSRAKFLASLVTDNKQALAKTLERSMKGKETALEGSGRRMGETRTNQLTAQPRSGARKEIRSEEPTTLREKFKQTLSDSLRRGAESRAIDAKNHAATKVGKRYRMDVGQATKEDRARKNADEYARKAERMVRKQYGINIDYGKVGALLASARQREGYRRLDEIRAKRKATLAMIDQNKANREALAASHRGLSKDERTAIKKAASSAERAVRKAHNINVDMGIVGAVLGSKNQRAGYKKLSEIREKMNAALAEGERREAATGMVEEKPTPVPLPVLPKFDGPSMG